MKVLELFAGTRSIGKAFEKRGHEVFSVEWNKDVENIDLYADILTVTAEDIIRRFGRPDVIWASPDCTTFSIAAISHHRRKNPVTGNLDPVSDYAKFCDRVDKHVLQLIRELNPRYYFIENPRGGMRKMEWMQGLPRYTVTYCQYETDKPVMERRMKPTDIWTNHPDPRFKPMCKNGRAHQHVQGRYNIKDTEGKYAHIVGNGLTEISRSNAHTLDWDGNAWFAGSVEGTAVILKSTTSGSTKRFRVTVDDSGTLSATEITE